MKAWSPMKEFGVAGLCQLYWPCSPPSSPPVAALQCMHRLPWGQTAGQAQLTLQMLLPPVGGGDGHNSEQGEYSKYDPQWCLYRFGEVRNRRAVSAETSAGTRSWLQTEKKTRISRWVRAAKSTTAESVVGRAFCTFTIQTSGLKKYHKLCLKDTLQHRSGCYNSGFCQQFPFSLYSHLYFNIPNGPPYRLHRDWILLQINHLVAASVSARRSQWLHHTPGSVLQYFS